jgi:hypothetical protein
MLMMCLAFGVAADVLLQALGPLSSELARLGPLIIQWLQFKRGVTVDTERMRIMEPGSIDFGVQMPKQLIIYLICLAYSNLAPIISFFGVIYFAIGYVRNTVLTSTDVGGKERGGNERAVRVVTHVVTHGVLVRLDV